MLSIEEDRSYEEWKKVREEIRPKFHLNVPRCLHIDGYVYDYKETISSTRNGARCIMRCSQRKYCNAYIHIPEKFDFERLKNTTDKPTMYSLNARVKYDINKIDNFSFYAFNMPHKCPSSGYKVQAKVDLNDPDFDYEYFSSLAKQNHWKGPEFFKAQARLDKKTFQKNQIEKFLTTYRKLYVPNDEYIQFHPSFGKTLDEPEERKQLFYQGKGEIADPKQGKNIKYAIFATKFSLGILSKSKRWYIDGTFKCSPKTFKQVVTIIGKYQTHNYPCVYIIMDSKKKVAYQSALAKVKLIMESYGLTFDKNITISADFEEGLIAAVKSVFGITTQGCFFHYVQSLWRNAKKRGLLKSTKDFNDVRLLILYLKILIHIDLDMRESFFTTLYTAFKEKGREFHDFFAYFRNNWLDHYFIKFPTANQAEVAERTNNVSESYNAVFNRKMGIIKPELGTFMMKLKQIEYDYRKRMLEKFEQGELNVIIDSELISLPFSQIYSLIEKNKDQLIRSPNFLKSGKRTELLETLDKLTDSCYKFIYGDSLRNPNENKKPLKQIQDPRDGNIIGNGNGNGNNNGNSNGKGVGNGNGNGNGNTNNMSNKKIIPKIEENTQLLRRQQGKNSNNKGSDYYDMDCLQDNDSNSGDMIMNDFHHQGQNNVQFRPIFESDYQDGDDSAPTLAISNNNNNNSNNGNSNTLNNSMGIHESNSHYHSNMGYEPILNDDNLKNKDNNNMNMNMNMNNNNNNNWMLSRKRKERYDDMENETFYDRLLKREKLM